MKIFIISILLLLMLQSFSQNGPSVSVIDFVKIKDNHKAEAMFYYENNWKQARVIALQRGYIKSYSLLETMADSTANFELLLITVYEDSIQLSQSENNFQSIFKEWGNKGPMLLNDLKPSEFRQNVFAKKATHVLDAY